MGTLLSRLDSELLDDYCFEFHDYSGEFHESVSE